MLFSSIRSCTRVRPYYSTINSVLGRTYYRSSIITTLAYDRLPASHIFRRYTTHRAAVNVSLSRFYTTHSSDGPKDDGFTDPTPTTETYLKVLESAAASSRSAMDNTIHDKSCPEDRMKRAYGRLILIVMYLGRPQEEEAASAFLDAFEKAPTSPGSDLSRARNAISYITGMIVRDLSSIPVSSPLRTKYSGLFAILGALQPICDVYAATADTDASADTEVQDEGRVIEQLRAWSKFWSRAQPVLLALGMKLDEGGFGNR